jgi:hypothetical protein
LPSEVDLINAVLVINGTTATIYAHGANPDFDLASMIAEITTLDPTIETVQVDLRSDLFTQNTTLVNADAILLENSANTVSNELRVRTGGNVPTTLVQTTSDYNLVQSAAIDTDGRDLVVNAAGGVNHGGTLSPFQGSTLNGGDGSMVTLDDGDNVFGSVFIRDSADTVLRENDAIVIGETTVNGDFDVATTDGSPILIGENEETVTVGGDALFVSVGLSAKDALGEPTGDPESDLDIEGNLTVGGSLLAVAGEDITIGENSVVEVGEAAAFVVDENAGTESGFGWFINEGQVSSINGPTIVYAVAGPQVPATHSPVDDQVVLGNLDSGTNWDQSTGLLSKYGVSYQGGGAAHTPLFSSYDMGNWFAPAYAQLPGNVVLWYKVEPLPIPSFDLWFYGRSRDNISQFVYHVDTEDSEGEDGQPVWHERRFYERDNFLGSAYSGSREYETVADLERLPSDFKPNLRIKDAQEDEEPEDEAATGESATTEPAAPGIAYLLR